MAAFFINRPVFAWVIAIIIMLSGGLALNKLPVEHYPDIALPQISVSAQYPGASASIIDQSVTQIIEQQIKGLDNLLYMNSTSSSSGESEILLTFNAGTDIDIAQVQVQNKLQQAMSQLPDVVQKQGVQALKAVENSFMTVAFYDESDTMRGNDISDYVASSLVDALSRIQGVGSVTLYGYQNAMRIWCYPDKMLQYKLNPKDVITAVQEQNAQVAGGQTGAAPAPPGQEVCITINASSSLETVKEFENIILKVREDGSVLYLKDVARIELNEEQFMAAHGSTGIWEPVSPSSWLRVRMFWRRQKPSRLNWLLLSAFSRLVSPTPLPMTVLLSWRNPLLPWRAHYLRPLRLSWSSCF